MSVCILSCFLIFLLGFISSLTNLLGKKGFDVVIVCCILSFFFAGVASLVGVEAGGNEDFFNSVHSKIPQ
jgi:hypothetical protein